MKLIQLIKNDVKTVLIYFILNYWFVWFHLKKKSIHRKSTDNTQKLIFLYKT